MSRGSNIQGWMITKIVQHPPKPKNVSTISLEKTNLWERLLGLKTTSSLITQYQFPEVQQSI
jgi:hypothetical protein